MTCTETACGISPKNRSMCRTGGGWASYAHIGRMPRKRAAARRSKTLRTYPRTLGITWGQGVLTVTKTKGSLGCLTLRQKCRICTLLCASLCALWRGCEERTCVGNSLMQEGCAPRLKRGAHPEGGRKAWPRHGQKLGPRRDEEKAGSGRYFPAGFPSQPLEMGRFCETQRTMAAWRYASGAHRTFSVVCGQGAAWPRPARRPGRPRACHARRPHHATAHPRWIRPGVVEGSGQATPHGWGR